MSVYKKIMRFTGAESHEEKLYKVLIGDTYRKDRYERQRLGENMESISTVVCGYWKQRYLLDHKRKIAFEIMDSNQTWLRFTKDDIDWSSLKKLPDEAKERAEALSAFYPSFIRRFENGVAEVSWQLIPDGRFWMDDDGYGMTSDEEIPVYAMVDKDLNVLVKFRYINGDYSQLKSMRQQAEKMVTQKISDKEGGAK